jgi:hypothetical protein
MLMQFWFGEENAAAPEPYHLAYIFQTFTCGSGSRTRLSYGLHSSNFEVKYIIYFEAPAAGK